MYEFRGGTNFQTIALTKGGGGKCANLNNCVMESFKLKTKEIVHKHSNLVF